MSKLILLTTFIYFCILTYCYCKTESECSSVSSYSNHTVYKNETKKIKVRVRRSRIFGGMHSLQNLSRWAAREEQIVPALQKRLEMIRIEERLIDEYLKDYSESSGEALKHVYEPKETPQERGEVIGSSYVLGHRMISRYTSMITKLKDHLNSEAYLQNLDNIGSLLGLKIDLNSTESSLIWPNWEDKYMSMKAFFHIQEINGFTAEELVSGLTYDTSFGGSLTAFQCAELGIFALQQNYTYMAIEWLELAKKLVLDSKDDSVSIEFVSGLLNAAIVRNNGLISYLQGNPMEDETEEAYDDYDNFLFANIFLNPVKNNDGEDRRKRRITGREVQYNEEKKSSILDVESHSRFIDLCRGERLQSPATQAKLRCYYEQMRHPYLYINPLKAEQLSETPPLIQFYEFIPEVVGKRIIQYGTPHLSLSEVVGGKGHDDTTRFRTSVGAGLPHKEALNTMKLAEIVSGLNLFKFNASEDTQLVEYTYGRFYNYHADPFEEDMKLLPKEETKLGDRLATILYYLKLPKLGGLTPMCYAGVSAYPVPGSAVLWYNMYRNGTVRHDVDHGACPVLHGHKIITNHWIRYNGNFLNYKCSLNQFE